MADSLSGARLMPAEASRREPFLTADELRRLPENRRMEADCLHRMRPVAELLRSAGIPFTHRENGFLDVDCGDHVLRFRWHPYARRYLALGSWNTVLPAAEQPAMDADVAAQAAAGLRPVYYSTDDDPEGQDIRGGVDVIPRWRTTLPGEAGVTVAQLREWLGTALALAPGMSAHIRAAFPGHAPEAACAVPSAGLPRRSRVPESFFDPDLPFGLLPGDAPEPTPARWREAAIAEGIEPEFAVADEAVGRLDLVGMCTVERTSEPGVQLISHCLEVGPQDDDIDALFHRVTNIVTCTLDYGRVRAEATGDGNARIWRMVFEVPVEATAGRTDAQLREELVSAMDEITRMRDSLTGILFP